MKKSEQVLLIITIGVGVALAATRFVGKGRTAGTAETAGQAVAAEEAAGAPSSRPTLELLASGQIELTPVAEVRRNPFRPVSRAESVHGVPVALSVTGIFGQEGSLSASLRGERASASTGGVIVELPGDAARVEQFLAGEHVRLTRADARLAELLRGKLVRAGDAIGGLRVQEVTREGVRLRQEERELFVPFQPRGGTSPRHKEQTPEDNLEEPEPAER